MNGHEDFDATDHFGDDHADIYDEKIRQVILGYDEMHDLSYYLLKDILTAEADILVSGVGTGHEALTYAGKQPGWTVTGVDPTPEMVRSAQVKTKNLGLESRVEIRAGTVESLKKTDFDAATSILVMQFLKDNGDKEHYLKAIGERLKTGGKLVLIDLEGEKGSKEFARLLSAWKCHQYSTRNDHEQIDKDFEHVDADLQFIQEKRIRELLHIAGFRAICKFYKSYLLAGYLAEKA